MSKVKFTPEQQQMLRENPYTIRVTADVLSLSKEFKEIFYKEYLCGALPRDILQKYGYPAEVLGKQRIWGISQLNSTRNLELCHLLFSFKFAQLSIRYLPYSFARTTAFVLAAQNEGVLSRMKSRPGKYGNRRLRIMPIALR